MPLNDYHFVTGWRARATVAEVLALLGDPLDLPRWWPSVYLSVTKLENGTFALHTKGFLPYTLQWRFRVTEERADGFALDAFGDFVGHGDWRLTQEGDEVKIVYDWRIRAEKPLLRLFSPILKSIFAANHRWAMQQGERSLRAELTRRRTP